MDYALLTENEVTSSDETGESSAAPGEAIESDDDCMTVLVMQESQHRSVWAYPVEKKGATEEWLSAQILDDLETVGLQGEKIVLKSDQEPAIVDVARDISRARQGAFGTAMETSAVGESDSNATVERAIQDVEGQARTLRAALEQRVQHKVRLRHPVVPWMVRHAAALITRYRVRPSGRTSLEMIKGRRSNAQITEFGEVILFKIPKTKLNPGKFEDQWDSGVYLGFDMRSMETLVGTPAGVFKCTDFKRKPVQERWSMERLNNIAGSPKQPVPGQAYRRSPAYSRRAGSSAAAGEFVRQPMPEQPNIRNWKIYRRDIEEHGGTPGCPGCRAVTHGMSGHAPHTALCRERIQGLIMETEEGRGRIDRAAERATAGAEQSEEERVAAPSQGGEDRTGSASAGPAVNPPTPPAPEATQTPLYRPTAPLPPYRPPPPRQD